MSETITSLHNRKVAFLRSLSEKKGRDSARAFLVEGTKMVSEALNSDFPIDMIILREDYDPAFPVPGHIPCCRLADHVFQSVCSAKTPQGIAAVVRTYAKQSVGRRLIALDGLQDPGNVGTVIRTADAAGFNGVLLSRDCADVFSPKVLRASMGSIFHIGLELTESLPDLLAEYREEGYSVISSQLDGGPFYSRGDLAEPYILIVGNEGNGISDAVKASATHRYRLPMRGEAESLNVAVAAGIMMYDLTRSLPG